jgi:hypothetical protein
VAERGVEEVTLTNEQIAEIADELNSVYCRAIGDPPGLAWDEAPASQRESVIAAVEAIRDRSVSRPEDSHRRWVMRKLAEGWTYGPVKDAGEKRHPCCLDFHELAPEQQMKDVIFFELVTSLTSEV